MSLDSPCDRGISWTKFHQTEGGRLMHACLRAVLRIMKLYAVFRRAQHESASPTQGHQAVRATDTLTATFLHKNHALCLLQLTASLHTLQLLQCCTKLVAQSMGINSQAIGNRYWELWYEWANTCNEWGILHVPVGRFTLFLCRDKF